LPDVDFYDTADIIIVDLKKKATAFFLFDKNSENALEKHKARL
jgi:hypothetical protein